MSGRIGQFFLFVGLMLLVIFFASDLAQAPNFNLFFLGLAGVVGGVLLMRRGREPAPASGRFRLIRQLFGGKKKKKSQSGEEAAPGEEQPGA